MKIIWEGEGIDEVGIYDSRIIIRIDTKYFRPTEVNHLQGNFSKAKKILKWKPKRTLNQLVEEMIEYELKSNDQ